MERDAEKGTGLKSSIQCAFLCVLEDAQYKTAKTGQDFLSLTVTALEDAGGKMWGTDKIWITAFHDAEELSVKLKPKQTLHVRGTAKLLRWIKDSVEQTTLRVNADEIAVLFDVDAMPRPRAKAAAKDASKEASRKQSAPPLQNGALASGDTLKPAFGLFQAPAPQGTGAKYERPFDDPLPF